VAGCVGRVPSQARTGSAAGVVQVQAGAGQAGGTANGQAGSSSQGDSTFEELESTCDDLQDSGL